MNYYALDEALAMLEGREVVNEASWNVKKYHEDDNEDSYKDRIKKDKSKIEKAVNRVSKELFKTFGEDKISKYRSKMKADPKSEKYYSDLIADIEKFMKGKAPTVSSFDQETDYIEIQMKFAGNANQDLRLFYQDELVKALNKDNELKTLGYKFSSEDYLAIYIIPIS